MSTAIYYSPSGNPEVWEIGKQPEDYVVEEEYLARMRAEQKATYHEWRNSQEGRQIIINQKLAEFDAAMAAVDRALVRPLSDLLDALLTPAALVDDTEPSADTLAASREKFLRLRELQIRNRELRAEMLEATTVGAVEAFQPVTAESANPASTPEEA